jgi:hypothetical protein
MRYKEFLVSTHQQIKGDKPIKFPVKILFKGLLRLQVKRYYQLKKKVFISFSSLI